MNALVLAEASQVAYRTPGEAQAWANQSSFTGFRWLNIGRDVGLLHDLQAFVAVNDDAAILAFRGSASAMDWFSDLRATPVR